MQGAVTKIIRILQVLFFTENRKENNEMGMSRYIQKTCNRHPNENKTRRGLGARKGGHRKLNNLANR